MRAVRAAYGFDFPAELESFHEFWQKNAPLCACLEMSAEGPLAVLAGTSAEGFDPSGGWPRFYLDPPEFFTVLTGHTDGLHWGLWFDDTSDPDEATTASYFHGDGLNLRDDGSLFEALRTNLELFHRDAESYLLDDPASADEYRERLDELARLREAIGEFDLAERDEMGEAYLRAHPRLPEACARKRVAETRTGMGIVVPSAAYRPSSLGPLPADRAPTAAEVEARVTEARTLAEAGAPGAALALGQDLWSSRAHHVSARAMLDLAYRMLGRESLRDHLRRACELRARSDQ